MFKKLLAESGDLEFYAATNWEIDLALHVLRSGEFPVDAEPNERQRIYIVKDFDNENYSPEVARKYVDVPRYCENWCVTMPIAVEKKISLRWLDGVKRWGADQVFDNQCGVYSSFHNESPLRAVVICLIKLLKDKK